MNITPQQRKVIKAGLRKAGMLPKARRRRRQQLHKPHKFGELVITGKVVDTALVLEEDTDD